MGHAHPHERGKAFVAHAGIHHALLTSHLSRASGNELDIFFETDDHENPKPLAFAVISIKGTIKKGGVIHEVVFEQAPADERPPGEGAKCSHFVAKTPQLTKGDVVDVRVTVPIDSVLTVVEWSGFDVAKFCHHEE
eukprot:Phypoly_transcript_21183.p1 GENE.Phypoly_transcript_21183~~Phypoly_transcript_21183.p1  ORF type:complete len:136 (+),score=19.81 Phypoly_transcript_21183:117-524(+)